MEQVLIERLRDVTPSLTESPTAGKSAEPASDFAEIVSGLISEVNESQNVAESNAEGLAKGEVGIMDAVVSLNEADLSLRMMIQIRDRALDAYQRIMRSI